MTACEGCALEELCFRIERLVRGATVDEGRGACPVAAVPMDVIIDVPMGGASPVADAPTMGGACVPPAVTPVVVVAVVVVVEAVEWVVSRWLLVDDWACPLLVMVDILPRVDPLLVGDFELLDINKGLVLGEVNLTVEWTLTVGVVIVGLYGLGGVPSTDTEELRELSGGGVAGEGEE